MNNFSKNLALWVIIGLLLIALFNLFQSPSTRGTSSNLAFSDFLAEVEGGRVAEVTIQGEQITGRTSSGTSFQTYTPNDPA
ncbi:MAG TPA: ATP-dependent metallopeptidase FtsH/Yme1/Tma family protein, partial [Geminicoccaceae bacterium]|nr:ATP-dependent metallopeptidase FtsH/Yme1/Tma family protein [Geminicoccaceae bacterium]